MGRRNQDLQGTRGCVMKYLLSFTVETDADMALLLDSLEQAADCVKCIITEDHGEPLTVDGDSLTVFFRSVSSAMDSLTVAEVTA